MSLGWRLSDTWQALLWLIPIGYQLVAIYACVRHRRKAVAEPKTWPAVSVLKPSPAGEWPDREALESNRRQDYPGEFEVVAEATPGPVTPNRKVGKLLLLAKRARHGIWVQNDGDIVVPPHYLRSVVSTLSQPGVGVVTCLFRPFATHLPGKWEALGIAIDFMPSTLVASAIGIREFGLGATLAFRVEDHERAGGFAVLADYIADDYQLAKNITLLGLRAEIAPVVVETDVNAPTWLGVWKHQVRWARTIKVSRTDGYAGMVATHAGVWAIAALALQQPGWAAAICLARIVMAWVGGVAVIGSSLARRWFFLAPLWDLWAFVVWITGWVGATVEWRGEQLRLDGAGRIHRAW